MAAKTKAKTIIIKNTTQQSAVEAFQKENKGQRKRPALSRLIQMLSSSCPGNGLRLIDDFGPSSQGCLCPELARGDGQFLKEAAIEVCNGRSFTRLNSRRRSYSIATKIIQDA